MDEAPSALVAHPVPGVRWTHGPPTDRCAPAAPDDERTMSTGNRTVARLLTSPLHRILSGSTALIRYTGPKSGLVRTTPVQYARYGSAVVIAVAHPDAKTWWRSFRRDHRLDVLVAGTWIEMTGLVVDPATHPDEAAPLLAAYLARFPRAARALQPADGAAAVLVWCRPC